MEGNKLSLLQFDGHLMPFNFFEYEKFRQTIDYIPRNDDIFIAGFPKSGTTWTGYIVWEILNDAKVPPFVNEMWYESCPTLEQIGTENIPKFVSQLRLFKSHLSFSYIPFNENAKYIYVARNPFDVCLSLFRAIKGVPEFCGFIDSKITLNDVFESFVNGYTPFGDYFDHILLWFSQRMRPNVLFITYEQLKSNHKEYVIKIAEFMGKTYSEKLLNSNELLDKIVYYTDFEYMKTLPLILGVNKEMREKREYNAGKNIDLVKSKEFQFVKFFNVGKVGHSFSEYNQQQIDKMNSMIQQKFKNIPELIEIWRSSGVKLEQK